MTRFTRRRVYPLFSSTLLFFLIGALTFCTNVFLASWLPVVAPTSRWSTRIEIMAAADIHQLNTTSSSIPNDGIKGDDGNLLHIVSTRFMQQQGHLHALAEARLLLFETFCLPSMKQQTIDDFVWIVMTDPELDVILIERLVKLLSPYPNFYLVLSNAKQFSVGEEFEFELMHPRILTGDISRLYHVFQSPTRQLLLQTRVDADDGLNKRTLKDLQDKAREVSRHDDAAHDQNNNNNGWQVVCANLHLEWRNNDITSANVTFVSSAGKLRIVSEQICVTPGYTLVSKRNTTSLELPLLPKIAHHLVIRDWPECYKQHVTTTTTNSSSSKGCWTKLDRYPAALRSRTITSAGMSRIDAESDYDNITKTLWRLVERHYGISPDQAAATSQYIKQHLQSIVQENLQGQW
jgi:hypothetical protein